MRPSRGRNDVKQRDLITLACFPKSGVTFLSSLLYYSLFDEEDRYEHVERESIVDIHAYPDAQPRTVNGVGFIKSHFPYSERDRWADRTMKAIFLTRDPIDVANSSYDYFHLLDPGFSKPREQFLDEWISTGGAAYSSSGTWRDHLVSWQKQRTVPLVTVSYVDLVDRPRATMGRIFDFLGFRVSDQCRSKAIEKSSMTAMRQREDAEFAEKRPGVFYKPSLEDSMSRGARFINKGYRDSQRDLTSDQAKAAEKQFGPLMRRYLARKE